MHELTVSELAAAIGRRVFSPTEVLTSVLDRISEIDPVIGAYRVLDAERSVADAKALTGEIAAGHSRGPMHGIPVAVKELIDVAGLPATYGSEVPESRPALADATVIERLRHAGAMIVGHTRSHEYGWGITTQHATLGGTVNPWNHDMVPGGSSGGSAAAVAAGLAPIALGSDTGGSIRIPSAFCGVLGFKPSFGLVPRSGVVPLAPTFDHVGAMSRSLADLRVIMGVIAGPDATDPSIEGEMFRHGPSTIGHPTRLSVGFSLKGTVPLDSEHESIITSGLSALADAGHTVREVDLPDPHRCVAAFADMQAAEAYDVHANRFGTYPERADRYGEDVRGRLEGGSTVTTGDYLDASRERLIIRDLLRQVFDSIDLLVTPVSAGGPSFISSPDQVLHGDAAVPFRDHVMGYTVLHNLTGIPSLSVPLSRDSQGLPVSLQIAARPGADQFVLDAVERSGLPAYSPLAGQ